MRSSPGHISHLEDVFSILRFRKRSMVSFRKFVILNVRQRRNANVLQDAEGPTQPMRVFHG
jgi:hypothetical protein